MEKSTLADETTATEEITTPEVAPETAAEAPVAETPKAIHITAKLPAVEDLLAAGSHFGHQTQRWNPKMKPYILTAKNGIHVINLEKTRDLLKVAGEAVARISGNNRSILFVGTKATARKAVADAAKGCNHFYVTNRWLGGMLTNFQTVRKSIQQIDKIEDMEASGLFKEMSKKEVLDKNREKEKLMTVFGGIREMRTLPGLMVVTDLHHEHIAVAEARRLRIPIVGICDTNVNPELTQYPIPSNDDAVKSLTLIVDYLAACATPRQNLKEQPQEKPEGEGRQERSERRDRGDRKPRGDRGDRGDRRPRGDRGDRNESKD
jgi:small subunit ribosomal protein S2